MRVHFLLTRGPIFGMAEGALGGEMGVDYGSGCLIASKMQAISCRRIVFIRC